MSPKKSESFTLKEFQVMLMEEQKHQREELERQTKILHKIDTNLVKLSAQVTTNTKTLFSHSDGVIHRLVSLEKDRIKLGVIIGLIASGCAVAVQVLIKIFV